MASEVLLNVHALMDYAHDINPSIDVSKEDDVPPYRMLSIPFADTVARTAKGRISEGGV